MDKKAYRAALLMGWLGTAGILSLAYYLARPVPPPPKTEADAFFDMMQQEADAVPRHHGGHALDPYPRKRK